MLRDDDSLTLCIDGYNEHHRLMWSKFWFEQKFKDWNDVNDWLWDEYKVQPVDNGSSSAGVVKIKFNNNEDLVRFKLTWL